MKENYNSVVSKSEDFTEAEERNVLFLFKHKFFARWLSFQLIHNSYMIVFIYAIISVAFLLGIIEIGGLLLYSSWCTTILIIGIVFIPYGIMTLLAMIVVIVEIIIMFHSKIEDDRDLRDLLLEKIQNIWLWNRKVISQKDWRKIKKVSKENYSLLRSKKTDGESFGATFYLANCIQNEKLKIIWLVEYSIVENRWFGRAMLEKEGYVYDSSLRRTYKLSEYFEVTQAEKISEFTLEDYKETICGPFTHQSLEKFPEEFKKLRTVLKTKKEK